MKKTARILITLIMVVTMFFALAIPASAADFDFEKATENFSSTAVNTFELNVGEQTTLLVAWQGYACFTSDSSVVVISDDATVTAVGEGTAYAAIAMSDTMYMLYRFDVVDDAKNDTTTIGAVTSEKEDTTQNVTSKTDKDTSSKSYFEEVVSERQEQFEKDKQRMQDEYEETSSKMFKTFGIFAGIILALGITAIIVFVTIAKKQNSTPSGKTVTCPTCSAVQPYGTDICPICGTKLGK